MALENVLLEWGRGTTPPPCWSGGARSRQDGSLIQHGFPLEPLPKSSVFTKRTRVYMDFLLVTMERWWVLALGAWVFHEELLALGWEELELGWMVHV